MRELFVLIVANLFDRFRFAKIANVNMKRFAVHCACNNAVYYLLLLLLFLLLKKKKKIKIVVFVFEM